MNHYVRVTRPAPLGKGGFLLLMGIPLVSEELALVEQKVFLGRSSVVSQALVASGTGFTIL